MNHQISAAAQWVIVDWGTTNFRAFIMDSNNQCLERVACKTGLLQVKDQAFEQTLYDNLKDWFELNPQLPVFMAGMVGSKQGWHEAAYIETPLTLDRLNDSCLRFSTQWGSQIQIVPGVCHSLGGDRRDVMRGEEIQILGLIELGYAQDCLAILPGTHSKHAQIKSGELTAFSTFMTGEFFALLSEHSILGKNTGEQIASPEAFAKGVIDSQNCNLMHQAFMARTHCLFDQLRPNEVHDYLSGLLIGKELEQVDRQCYVISNAQLGKRYALACKILNKTATTVSGDDCFIAGMTALRNNILCHSQ